MGGALVGTSGSHAILVVVMVMIVVMVVVVIMVVIVVAVVGSLRLGVHRAIRVQARLWHARGTVPVVLVRLTRRRRGGRGRRRAGGGLRGDEGRLPEEDVGKRLDLHVDKFKQKEYEAKVGHGNKKRGNEPKRTDRRRLYIPRPQAVCLVMLLFKHP